MKLALLCFDDMVTIPGGKLVGGEMVVDACESTFRADDGWELAQVSPGVFTLRSPCMPEAMTVGGYGYRYIAAPPDPPPVPEPPKGKKR